jgi:hypothetical protein
MLHPFWINPNFGKDSQEVVSNVTTCQFASLMTGQKFVYDDVLYVKVPEVRMDGWISSFLYNAVTESFDAVRCHYIEPDMEVEVR